MDVSIISLLIPEYNRTTKLPRLYALSKTGAIRVYDIIVEDMDDHAVMTTRKKVTLDGKWTEDQYEYWEGVNIGKSNETTYLEQALNEAQSAWKRLKDAGFTTEMPNVESRFNTDANGNMKPMLAIGFNEKRIKFPCLVQPKLDGVRCLAFLENGEVQLRSRKGKPYDIPHLKAYLSKHTEMLPLDGELYNHKDLTFQEIVSAVKRHSEITPKIKYAVYDKPIDGVPNNERWSTVLHDYELIDKESPTYRVDWVYCDNMEQILKYHKKCVADGYEGVIIRNLDGLYEFGFRSNNLIKYKEFNDSEFQIADVIEATGRDAGTAIFVLYLSGYEGEEVTEENSFKAKPQGSRELRAEYFKNAKKLIGKMVTVQYQGFSDEGKPRFPSAISIRDYE